jgi:tRNA (adenine57-N1/adenine58-N1)-methyltransferase
LRNVGNPFNLSADSRNVFRQVAGAVSSESVNRVVLLDASGAKHLVPLDRETVSVPSIGVVRADTLRGLIGRRWTVGDRTFLVLRPSIRDELELVRRGAQIIGPKDAPVLLWNSDVKAGDFVIEVGAGSGAFTLALARAVGPRGRVVTYDLRPDFLDHARQNATAAGVAASVEFKIGDARKGLAERDADAVLVDVPDPWGVIEPAWEALGPCGHFASYSPNMEQVNRTVKALRSAAFVEVRSVEIIEREIVAHEAGTHPSFAPLGHTGYLTFARKVLDTF